LKKEGRVYAIVVPRDSQWVVTTGGDGDHGELKSCEVEIGMIRTSRGFSMKISCIDISADNTS
jgi:hypothetical protein